MDNRWVQIAVVICWMASMSWLMVEKVLPPLRGGNRPDYESDVPDSSGEPEITCWQVQWNEQPIGWAVHRALRHADGTSQVRSVVLFEKLPLDQIVAKLLGSWGSVVQSMVMPRTQLELELEMTVASEMIFGPHKQLRSFTTTVFFSEMDDFIQLHGMVVDNTLDIAVHTVGTGPEAGEVYTRELYRTKLDLPEGALIANGLSPQSRLKNLRVGQTWTFPVYRPFPPNQPLEIVQAKVERDEIFIWDGRSLRALQVAYRSEAGSGIRAAGEPVSKLWVRHDGTVLKQQVRIANLEFAFLRQPDGSCEDKIQRLNEIWTLSPAPGRKAKTIKPQRRSGTGDD